MTNSLTLRYLLTGLGIFIHPPCLPKVRLGTWQNVVYLCQYKLFSHKKFHKLFLLITLVVRIAKTSSWFRLIFTSVLKFNINYSFLPKSLKVTFESNNYAVELLKLAELYSMYFKICWCHLYLILLTFCTSTGMT